MVDLTPFWDTYRKSAFRYRAANLEAFLLLSMSNARDRARITCGTLEVTEDIL